MLCVLFTTMTQFISVRGENSILVVPSSTANVVALLVLMNTEMKLKP